MIPQVTRFNPTVNGPLHLGHAYLALVNRALSEKFVVRFDDTQIYWNDRIPWQEVHRLKQTMLEDLSWLGIKIDEVYSQTEMQYEAHKRLLARCHEAGIPFPRDYAGEQVFVDRAGDNIQTYPFSPFKTAEKVIMDNMTDTSVLIRGNDLENEGSLYAFYCDAFRMYQPQQIYLPRLEFDGQVVSKTNSNMKIAEFRNDGIRAEVIIHWLKLSCLINPNAGWTRDNIKLRPVFTRKGESHELSNYKAARPSGPGSSD